MKTKKRAKQNKNKKKTQQQELERSVCHIILFIKNNCYVY